MIALGNHGDVTSWKSSAANGNWNNTFWYNVTQGWDNHNPNYEGYRDLTFDNTAQTTMSNDFSGNGTNQWKITFTSNSSSSRTIGGSTQNEFKDVSSNIPKIQNNSTVNHTINFPFRLGYSSGMEINPVAGDLTLGGAIDNNGKAITVYSDDSTGSSLIFNGVLSGSGKIVVKQQALVKINSTSTYSGNTEIDEGEFWFEAGSDIGNSAIHVGNGGDQGSVAKLWINDSNGGTTVDENITVNAGNDNTRYIGALNSSGENTYSGTVTLNDSVNLEANNAGGTITFSGVISGGQNVTLNGPGTVKMTAENTFGSSQTLYMDKGTLELNRASGDPLGCNEIKLGTTSADDVTLKLSSSGGFTVDNQINVRSSGGTKAIHNAAGSNTVSSSIYLDADLLVTNTAGHLVFSGTTLDLKNQTMTVKGGGHTVISGGLTDSTGSGKLTKTGSGTNTITGANTYVGATTVSAGLMVYNGTNTGSAVTIASGATLKGVGSLGSTTVNGTIAPGGSIGEIRTSALTLPAGGTYTVEMGDVDGSAGSDWDLINVNAGGGTVTISASSGSEFTIALDDSGISNFDNTSNYSWKIIDAATLSGFDATDFTIDEAAWSSAKGNGSFSLADVSGDLVLKFLVAEPAISHGPTALSYTMIRGKVPADKSYVVTNSAGGTLYYTNTISYGAATGWLSLTAPTTLTGGQTQTVTASITESNVVAGTHYATNTITGNHTNGAKSVVFTLNVSDVGDPTSVTGARDGGNPASKIDLSWVRDAATTANVMIVRSTDASFVAPTNGDTYAVNNTSLGGDKVVFNDAGTSFEDSGLISGTEYHYRLYSEYYKYYSTGVTTNITTSMPQARNYNGGSPEEPATLYVGDTGTFGCDSWGQLENNSAKWRVVIDTDTDLSDGSASAYGGSYVNQEHKTSTSPTFTSAGAWYWGIQVDYENFGAGHWYKADNSGWTDMATDGTGASLSVTVTALSGPGSLGAVTNTAKPYEEIDLSWTQSNGHNVMIVRGTDETWVAPTNGDAYSEGSTVLGGDTVVYNGSGTADTDTGLAYDITYYYRFYTVNNDYYSGGATVSEATEAAPPPEMSLGPGSLAFETGLGGTPSSQTFVATNTGVATLLYTNTISYGTGPGWLTLAPTNASLAADATQIHTASVSQATSVGIYTATNTLTGNQDNGAQTVTVTYTVTNLPNPTALSASSIGTTNLTVNWTKSADYNVMVVRRAGADPDPPSNGTGYTLNETYGTDNRNKVIYATDAGASAADVGLTAGTEYHYGFFSENFSYYSSGAFLTTTTKVASVDGIADEWVGTAPTVVNSSTIDGGEFIWTDKANERRDDSGFDNSVDMREFRMRADADNIYFYVKFAAIDDVDYPYIGIAVDSDRSAADGALAWIADESDTGLGDGYYTNGTAGLHYPERNIIAHGVPGTGQRVELHADDGSSWYAPSGGNDVANFNGTDGFAEFAVSRSDLLLTGSTVGRFTVASYFNNNGAGANNWANNTNTTAEYSGTDALDSLTVLPYGTDDAAGNKNAWDEDLSDGDLDTFFDVAFDANGIVANTLPTTPSATFPAEGATIEAGPMSVMWSESTDGDDEVTSYFVEISTDSDFGGGENLAVTRRGNAKHLDPMYAVSSTLAADTYYWRTRARDLDGALSGHVTNSFIVSGTADSDTTGPTPKLLYIGPTYTEGASQTNITDKDFANTNDYVDIAVVWSDDSGVFLTNSAAYPNTNIVSAWGRVIPNWDLYRTNTDTHATQDFGYDEPFTAFYGTNGAPAVTTVFYNAFSITNALLDELFFLRVSAEDSDDDRGDYPDDGHNGDPIPWDRAVTTNSEVLITITDDDADGPVFSAVNVDGMDYFNTRMSGDLVVTGLVRDAGSGVYASSNRYVLYRNNVQIDSGALSPAPGSDGAALASAEPIGVTIAEATATVPGAYRLDVSATDYDIERPGDSTTVTTSYYFTVSNPDFDYRMRINTPSYTGTGPMTNFPVQVVLNTSRSGFTYSQFASPTGGDLRFCDEYGDTWLDYAFKKWDTGGSSTNWVKIPVLTTNTVIWAYWGNTTGTNAAPATTNGAVWSDWSEAQAGTSNHVFNGYASVVEPGTYFEFDGDSTESGVSLPFTETFESVATGTLDGKNDWHALGTSRALNQTTKVYSGSRGAELEHAIIWHGVDDATGTNVWVNFFAWPEPCVTNPVDPSALSEDTTAVFYLNTDGQPVVLSNSTWVTYGEADLGTNNWIRFIVNLDYVADEWGLWAITATTNARVATGLPFENTTRSVFTSFRAVEGGLTPLSYFDNFGVGADKPLSVDTDEDDMPDMWEETYMTNLNQTDVGDLDSDGVSNLREYLAGTNPNDSNDLMRVIDVDLQSAGSSNVRLKLLGGGAIGNTNFFPVGDEVERTFKIYAANNSVTNTKTLVATIDADDSGTNTWTDNGMTDTYSSRYYEISVEHSSGGYTNTEEWAVHVQPRAASKSYMICAPVNYEGTNNTLTGLLGDHLARGLHADTTQGDSDRVEWIATDGSWARYWLSTTGWKIWGGSTPANVEVTPGQGMWVVRGSGGTTRNNAVFAGRSFTDDDVEEFSFSKGDAGLSEDGWTIFGWPLPEPLQARASDTSQNQLGFFSGGGTGGEHPDHTNAVAGDQIWIWNDGWSAYWLVDDHSGSPAADGRWWKGHGTSGDDFADITLEPGKAYYYFHTDNWGASDFNWTPTNSP